MPKTYQNAICLPCHGCENKALYPNATGGVYREDHEPIADAFLLREYRQDIKFNGQKWDRTSGQELKQHRLIVPRPIGETKARLSGTYIFAGYLFPHFGHFLLESLANYWFIKQHPETPIVWLGVHNQPDLTSLEKAFLDLYDIKNPIHILTEQTEVEELIVPEPGYRIHTIFTEEQIGALKVMDCPHPKEGKKVWLSRSKLPFALIYNEKHLESILESQGWTIFHPQNHSLREQVEMLSDAERVAGIEGSAFHLFVMLPDYRGRIDIFARRKQLEFDFFMIAETLGLNQEAHFPRSCVWSHDLKHWEYNRFWYSLTPVLTKLGISKRSEIDATAPENKTAKYVKVISQNLGRTKMLELWARTDTACMAVDQRCSALTVSETLQFNTSSLSANISHLDISADMLFTSNIGMNSPDFFCFRHHGNELELIRAFLSSTQIATPDAIWLIEYDASERDTSPSERLTKETQQISQNKKLIQFIASSMPMLSVARIETANVALIWRSPRAMMLDTSKTVSNILEADKFERAPVMSLKSFGRVYRKAHNG